MKIISLSRAALENDHFSAARTAAKALACALLICFVLSMTSFDAQSQELTHEVVRLHILANSDSDEDQRLKLEVRDIIQQLCADIYPQRCTRSEAEAILAEKLPQLVDEAQRVVREHGYDYNVSGELVNMYFTNRTYGDVTFPAGNYDALRLKIGSGEGHNWWCVMFPPMCVGAAQDCPEDVLSPEQAALVSSGGVEYKFKIYEIYKDLVSEKRDCKEVSK